MNFTFWIAPNLTESTEQSLQVLISIFFKSQRITAKSEKSSKKI